VFIIIILTCFYTGLQHNIKFIYCYIADQMFTKVAYARG